jgi:hypothetical protein
LVWSSSSFWFILAGRVGLELLGNWSSQQISRTGKHSRLQMPFLWLRGWMFKSAEDQRIPRQPHHSTEEIWIRHIRKSKEDQGKFSHSKDIWLEDNRQTSSQSQRKPEVGVHHSTHWEYDIRRSLYRFKTHSRQMVWIRWYGRSSRRIKKRGRISFVLF